jgi:hypothetical protein
MIQRPGPVPSESLASVLNTITNSTGVSIMATAGVSVNLSALSIKELLGEYNRMLSIVVANHPEPSDTADREYFEQVQREIVARCQTYYDPPISLANRVDYGIQVFTIDYRKRRVSRSLAAIAMDQIDEDSKAAGLYCPE